MRSVKNLDVCMVHTYLLDSDQREGNIKRKQTHPSRNMRAPG